MSKEVVYIFDVDNCCTYPRQPMTEEFAEKFREWSKDKKYCFVSGSDFTNKIQSQIPEDILIDALYIFCCNGNEVYSYERSGDGPLASYNDFTPKQIAKNEITITQELEDFLFYSLKYSNYSGPKFPPHIEHRTGLVNFSTPGRNSPQEIREGYEKFDQHDGERQRIANYINEKMPQYQCNIGGMISVDIFEKGKDKSQILSYFNQTSSFIKFYGDRCQFGGNDYPLCRAIDKGEYGDWTQVSGPDELINILSPKINTPTGSQFKNFIDAKNDVFKEEEDGNQSN